MFSSIKIYLIIGAAVAGWFLYGWGSQIVANYGAMAAKIERLERDKNLIESRVASYQTLLARRDAAIEASKCKVQIKGWIKDPDTLPGFKTDPFVPNAGG